MTLKDTAVLSGGYYETGTITFTLYQGSTLVDTETVTVTGNGTYTTPPATRADDGHGDGNLPVGRELQRRHRTITRRARTTRGRASDGQPGEPRDHDDAER